MELGTWLGDWSSGPGPLHRKLTVALRRALDAGVIRAGHRLPSERELALALVVSRGTVVAAYDALRAEGVVEGRQGSGTYVLAQAPRNRLDPLPAGAASPIFDRMISGVGADNRLISFASATIPAAPAVAEIMAGWDRHLMDEMLDGTGYLPLGLPALRAAVAQLLTSEGLPTGPEDVLITNGAQQAIALCASTLVRPGDSVIVESPTFPGCADAFAAAGARFVPVPVDEDGIIVDALAAVVARQPVAAIYVMPSFHNPTGALLPADRRRRLCEVAADADVPVVEDNALAHCSLGSDPLPAPIGAYRRSSDAPVITVGSVSKSMWGGLRIGWLRAPQPWFARLARRKVAADLGSGLLGQAVTARLLGRLPEIQAGNQVLLRERLSFCTGLLGDRVPDWRWVDPAGGPSLWVQIPRGDTAQFAQVALRHGVEVIPGAAFATDGSHNAHFRLPFAFGPSVMEVAIDRLGRAWDAYVPEAGRRLSPVGLGMVV